MIDMKRLTLILTILIGLLTTVQAESVYRFAVLEALVQNHKALSNRLRERGLIDASVYAATEVTTGNTEDYQDIIKTMQQRIEGAFASVQFVSDLAFLTMMAVKTAQITTDAVDTTLDHVGNNPLVIPATVYAVDRSGQCINTIYKLVSMVATAGTGIVLATNEDRAQFSFMIRSKLLEIQDLMANLSRLAWRAMSSASVRPVTTAGFVKSCVAASTAMPCRWPDDSLIVLLPTYSTCRAVPADLRGGTSEHGAAINHTSEIIHQI